MRNAVQLIGDYGFEKFLVVVLFVFILDYLLGLVIDLVKIKNIILYVNSIGIIVLGFYNGFFYAIRLEVSSYAVYKK